MALLNTRQKWGAVSQTFHWLTALAIFAMFGLGWIMADMAFSPQKFKLYSWHKSLGIVILAFVAVRLMWRLVNVTPVLPVHMHKLEKLAAHGAHVALYICMLGMPLSGWLMSSAAGLTVNVFGFFEIPDLVAVDASVASTFKRLHYWLSWGFVTMIALHVSAALYHHFVHRDNVLASMLPALKRR